MMLKETPLFLNKKEFILFNIFLLFIFLIRIYLYYIDFNKLPKKVFYYSNAKVVQVYPNKFNYFYKLTLENNFLIYLKSKVKAKKNDIVRVKFKVDRIDFLSFLKGSFLKGDILEIKKSNSNLKNFFLQKIDSQHQNKQIASFYKAIFLAEPLDRDLLKKISNLGVSHLIALSGFHLTILWSIIFFILYLPYKFFQKRYFPWRNLKVDLGFITLLFLAIFTIFTDAPASLVRSYIMFLSIWIFFILGVKLISFEFLTTLTLLILIFFPKFILSIGFFLSIMGVFYIFLLLKYLKSNNIFLQTIFISFGVFILIFPISHYFFTNFSIWQIISPIFSILFTIFYPLTLFLHFISYGYIFDNSLENIFNLAQNGIFIKIPIELFLIYIISSILAIFKKEFFYLTLFLAIIIFLYSIFLSF